MADLEHHGVGIRDKSGVLRGWHNLWCPDCERSGVTISEQGKREAGWPNFAAKCPHCGYGTDILGWDGSVRSAVAEWKLLCRSALKVKTQLLGASTMNEQLELNVTAFIGVTPWIDAEVLVPLISGWYNVRYKMSDEEREERDPPLQRRYWSTTRNHFSWPVEVGSEPSSEEMARCESRDAAASPSAFEWQGLTSQHPESNLMRRR